jgi:hypothetical protein
VRWAVPVGVVQDPTLGQEYFDTCAPVVDVRIAQAGVRLAAFLNNAFQSA